MTQRNVSAFNAKTAAGPASATMTPPSAGPRERARFTETLPSVTATGKLYDFRTGRSITYRLPTDG